MTSPINPINRSTTDALNSNGSTRARDKESTETSSSSPRPAAEDTVSLSDQSLQVRDLQQQLESLPEVDAEKVEAIKQEIAKGNYPLDPERIAQNLIKLEKALNE
ncbi:MAG: flagellar biosynthesis anti-sigma factor FlgM [Gammaproteobacteria bacterium]